MSDSQALPREGIDEGDDAPGGRREDAAHGRAEARVSEAERHLGGLWVDTARGPRGLRLSLTPSAHLDGGGSEGAPGGLRRHEVWPRQRSHGQESPWPWGEVWRGHRMHSPTLPARDPPDAPLDPRRSPGGVDAPVHHPRDDPLPHQRSRPDPTLEPPKEGQTPRENVQEEIPDDEKTANDHEAPRPGSQHCPHRSRQNEGRHQVSPYPSALAQGWYARTCTKRNAVGSRYSPTPMHRRPHAQAGMTGAYQ